MIWIIGAIVGVGVVADLVLVYSLCVVAGRASRAEERRAGEGQ